MTAMRVRIVAVLWVALAGCGGSGCGMTPEAGTPLLDANDADPGTAACPWIAEHVYPHPSDVLFEPSRVVRLDLELDPADYQFLLDNPDLEEYRPAAVVFCGERLEGAGLRFKRSSLPSADLPEGYPKNPMLVDLSEFNPGQKLRGLRHINLEYGGDLMLVAERMSWESLRESGVTASRVNHVGLWVNGAYTGVFTNVERVDRSYVAFRFGNDAGNLYKHQYCGTFVWEGPDPAPYLADARCYEKKTNEAAADYADLIHLIDVVNNTPDDQLEAALPEVLNLDAWIPLMAGMQVLAYGDTPNANGNNFYSYHSSTPDRFEIIPWDVDGGFFQPDAPCEHPADTIGWDLFRIGACHAYLPLFERVVGRPAWRQRYLDAARAFADGPFAETTYPARVDALVELLLPELAGDPWRDGDDAGMAAQIADLKDRHAQRLAAVRAQLP